MMPRCDAFRLTRIGAGEEMLQCVYKEGHQGDHQCADVSWPRETPPAFTLTEFQQQIVRDTLLAHQNRTDSFCTGYDKAGCKYRIPWDGVTKMRESFAQHQVDEIVKALS